MSRPVSRRGFFSAKIRYPETVWNGGNAFYQDVIHATGNGNLLNATVMYTVFTGGEKSPVGLPLPTDLAKLVGTYDPAKLDIILDIGYSVGRKALGQGPVAVRDLHGTRATMISANNRNTHYDLAGRPVPERSTVRGLKIAAVDGRSARPFVVVP